MNTLARERRARLEEQWAAEYEDYWRRITAEQHTGTTHVKRLFKLEWDKLTDWQKPIVEKLRRLLA